MIDICPNLLGVYLKINLKNYLIALDTNDIYLPTFFNQRKILRENLLGINSQLIWQEVKEILSKILISSEDIDEDEANTLFGLNKSDGCLLVETMNIYFNELLKNAIDSFIVRSKKTNLAIRETILRLAIYPLYDTQMKTLTFLITDNGDGFSNTYLSKFKADIKNRKLQKVRSHKKGDPLLLGGQGLGLHQLATLLYSAQLNDKEEGLCFSIPPNELAKSQIEIANGLVSTQIILTSSSLPVIPFVPPLLAPTLKLPPIC